MIRISAVSYLNTKPFLYGLNHSGMKDISVSLDTPAECARKLLSGEVETGLVPVAIIPLLKSPWIIPGYGICADGPVESVMLYSNVPLQEIKTVYLDYQSRTSVMLARVLAREHWKISPRWENAEAGFEEKIPADAAAVVIGDRTFRLNGKHAYEFDLAGEWKKFTGLPFVFACWVSNVQPGEKFVSDFRAALEYGLNNTGKVIEEVREKYRPFDVEKYLTSSLKFRMGEKEESGMRLFLSKMKELQPVG
ncbi:MAG TPA: menaquinone biosynthesis protein [Bacteroidia bacterium]|nr:menaquinone biosynthesis protein [Bacteroidia bacterium]